MIDHRGANARASLRQLEQILDMRSGELDGDGYGLESEWNVEGRVYMKISDRISTGSRRIGESIAR